MEMERRRARHAGGAKTHRMGGSDPTFRSFGSQSDPWVAPAHPSAITAPPVFAPPPQKDEKGRRKTSSEERMNEGVDGYATLIERGTVLDINSVLWDMSAGDCAYERWKGRPDWAASTGSAILWAGAE
jgi:hypothetical protein